MTKSTKSKKEKRVIKKYPWLTVLVISGILIVFGSIAISFLIPKPVTEQADFIDKSSVINARNANEPIFDQDQHDKTAVLSNAGIITTPNPEYSSKIDVCYANHNDAGWTITGWYQDCYFRYVDLFQTSLSRADVVQKLTSLPTSNTFGVPDTFHVNICDELYSDHAKPTLSYLTWSLSDAKSPVDCTAPDMYQGVSTVKGSTLLDKELIANTHPYRTFATTSINKNKSYIAMQLDDYYFNASLGCPGSGLFGCSAQPPSPVTGF